MDHSHPSALVICFAEAKICLFKCGHSVLLAALRLWPALQRIGKFAKVLVCTRLDHRALATSAKSRGGKPHVEIERFVPSTGCWPVLDASAV